MNKILLLSLVLLGAHDNGGSVHPYTSTFSGMSYEGNLKMRDYFAGHALEGIIASRGLTIGENPQKTVKQAYEYADAMLKESKK